MSIRSDSVAGAGAYASRIENSDAIHLSSAQLSSALQLHADRLHGHLSLSLSLSQRWRGKAQIHHERHVIRPPGLRRQTCRQHHATQLPNVLKFPYMCPEPVVANDDNSFFHQKRNRPHKKTRAFCFTVVLHTVVPFQQLLRLHLQHLLRHECPIVPDIIDR